MSDDLNIFECFLLDSTIINSNMLRHYYEFQANKENKTIQNGNTMSNLFYANFSLQLHDCTYCDVFILSH